MDHDDVIKSKHLSSYWTFVRGIRRSPGNSPHKGQWYGTLMFSLICALNLRLSKQSWGWWFETPLRSLWRHCNMSICFVVIDQADVLFNEQAGTNLLKFKSGIIDFQELGVKIFSAKFILIYVRWCSICIFTEMSTRDITMETIRLTLELLKYLYWNYLWNVIFRINKWCSWKTTSFTKRLFVLLSPRWILRTKASDAELWYFPWSASEQTVE